MNYSEFSQFLHDYHNRYSKYAFKAFNKEGTGMITSDEFCDLLTSVKVGPRLSWDLFIFFQGHLLTEKVRKVLKDFVQETQGETVTYAYSTAFQNLLTDIETAKKVTSIDRNGQPC